ncbi:MAG: YfiT family bacillithiol transferase [Planctomycetota bacterium]
MNLPLPPAFPAGEYVPPDIQEDAQLPPWIDRLEAVPARVRAQIAGLDEQQLDTRYRNWTIRQIVHHLADSHVNCYVRCKWALTEATPTIKSYDETAWSEVIDATTLPLESSLRILEGVHARWAALLHLMDAKQLQRAFFHPELQREVTVRETVPNYVWHADHHLAQIEWVCTHHGFTREIAIE